MPTDREHAVSFTPAPASPCVTCRFFRLVPLPSGRNRAVCSFSGEKLAKQGVPLCVFRQVPGGGDAA